MTQTIMLVKTETNANNNKFYRLELRADGSVFANWGRVGASGQSMTYPGGQATFDKKLREKKRKGYQEVEVVDGGNTKAANQTVLQKASAKGLAKDGFSDDERLLKLVDSIVAVNAHDITTASGGKITLADGVLRTPLGVIGQTSLDKADEILVELNLATSGSGGADRTEQVKLLEQYLMLVPQKVGARRGWEDDLLTPAAIGQQVDFVKQLRDSLDFVEAQQQAASGSSAPEVAFRYKMGVIEADDPRFEQVRSAFARTLNDRHPSRRYKLVGLYDVFDGDEPYARYADARERLGNEGWYWHGTRASNVLSILSKGLYVPPANASFTTGRMFGPGVYMSKQSTKSLNYSGGYWAGQQMSDKAFMFSLQAVMGSSYRPTTAWRNSWADVHAKHNSINVAAGTAGVANHEAIVWNLDQLRMRYLCEFSL